MEPSVSEEELHLDEQEELHLDEQEELHLDEQVPTQKKETKCHKICHILSSFVMIISFLLFFIRLISYIFDL